MSEEKEKRSRSRAMENLSLELDRYPRDLLQRFMSTDTVTQPSINRASEEDKEEIELNLGLSLGGRFGVDKTAKKLIRSSSIAGTVPLIRGDGALTSPPVQYPSLVRTSSLPTETEEEWRKRKEMQSLRRMEAKRRRSEKEKQRSSSNSRPEVNMEDERRELRRTRSGFGVQPPFGLLSWANAARQLVLEGAVEKGKAGFLLFQGQGQGQPGSQGSVESHGGSSSGIMEFESKPLQGSSSCGEARSTVSNQSSQERNSKEAVGSSGLIENENLCRTCSTDVGKLSRKPDSVENRGKETGTDPMKDMPCVFTRGDGPNGKTIEGILYKYGKGEDVRIMCVCHGEFLSPAEFVKHAGGSDVDHPLRHIVVNPSASPFS